jgi:hypothetical protein
MSHRLGGGHVPDKHGGGDRQDVAQLLRQSGLKDSTRKEAPLSAVDQQHRAS